MSAVLGAVLGCHLSILPSLLVNGLKYAPSLMLNAGLGYRDLLALRSYARMLSANEARVQVNAAQEIVDGTIILRQRVSGSNQAAFFDCLSQSAQEVLMAARQIKAC